jgi:hypothetical protein
MSASRAVMGQGRPATRRSAAPGAGVEPPLGVSLVKKRPADAAPVSPKSREPLPAGVL